MGEGVVTQGDFGGRNFNFGVREHGMASVLNGLALYGQFRVFGATFLIFFRLYAAQHAPCRFNETARNLYSHTRLTLCGRRWANSPTGGDNRVSAAHSQFECFRPADAEETAWSWVEAMKRLDGPSALILTRQGLPMLAKPEGWDFTKGAYIVREEQEELAVVLVAAGSEVNFALRAADEVENRAWAYG